MFNLLFNSLSVVVECQQAGQKTPVDVIFDKTMTKTGREVMLKALKQFNEKNGLK